MAESAAGRFHAMSTDAEWISVNETLARFSMSRSTFYRHRDHFVTKLLGANG